jgi:hypothetical protein
VVSRFFATEHAAFLPLRKNGVVLYHEILSLSGFDQGAATTKGLCGRR